MNHTICYVSKGFDNLSNADIENIFEVTQQENVKNEITGILLYGFGNFFQVLEGEKKQIESLFSKICDDPRHHSIETLIDHHIKKPIFGSYSSKFNVIKTNDELAVIKSYLELFRITPFSNKINRLLNPFLHSL